MKNFFIAILMITILPGCAYPLLAPVLTTGAVAIGVAEDTRIYDDDGNIDVNLALPDAEDLKKLNPIGGGFTKSQLTVLFFESSNYYLQSQELLLKAYNRDTEAQIVREAIEYANNSKNSEADRMKNSIKVTTEASNILKNSINLETDKISAEGTIMYNNALIPAGKGIISTIKLVPVSVDMAQRLANPVSAVTLITELGGLVEIIPNIPSYISTMVLTMKLVVTGAKANNIEGANDLEANLGELIL